MTARREPMMRRLLDDSNGGSSFERDLLRAGANLEPPKGADAAIFAALLAKTAAGAAATASTAKAAAATASQASSVAKASAGAAKAGAAAVAAKTGAGGAAIATAAGAGLLKSVLIGAGSAIFVLGTYSVVAPPAKDDAPVPTVAAVVAPPPVVATPTPKTPQNSGVAPAPTEVTSADPAPPPSAAAPHAAKSADSDIDRLKQESAMLATARDALRRGDAAGALAQLEKTRAAFPGGVLVQEREALTIEALYQRGDRGAAAERAKAFLKAYPASPHATRIAAFAGN
jgi:hypothetical protein